MALLVLGGMRLGVLAHLLDLLLGEAAGGGDRDLLLLAGTLVLRGDVEDAVRVDVERHLDLRNAARCGRDAVEVEVAERLVVARHLAVALEDRDRHGRLVVRRRREDLRLLRRNRRVALDERSEDAAQRLDAEREGRHVEKEDVLDFALQDAALNRSAHRHHFVGVHALVGLLAEERLRLLLEERHAGLAANEHHFVDAREVGVGHALAARLGRAVHEIHRQRLEDRARKRRREVQRARLVHRDERQVDVVRRRARERALRLLGLFFQALLRHRVGEKVDAVVLLEVVCEPGHDRLVEIVAAEVRIAVRRLHLEDTVADVEDRDIERAAAEVVDCDLLILLLVEAIRERGRSRLVHNALHVKSCDAAGVLRRLTLLVVEVGRDGDDRLGDLLAEKRLGVFLQLAEHHRGNLLRGVNLARDFDRRVAVRRRNDLVGNHLDFVAHLAEAAADEALDGVDRRLRVRHCLTLRGLADENLAVLRECDD